MLRYVCERCTCNGNEDQFTYKSNVCNDCITPEDGVEVE